MLKPLLITVCAIAWQYAVHVLIRASAAIRTLSIVFILLWFFWVSWKSVGDKLLLRLMAVALVVMELVTYTPYSGALNEYRHLYSGAKNCAAFIREELPSDTIFLEVNVARGSSLCPTFPRTMCSTSPTLASPRPLPLGIAPFRSGWSCVGMRTFASGRARSTRTANLSASSSRLPMARWKMADRSDGAVSQR